MSGQAYKEKNSTSTVNGYAQFKQAYNISKIHGGAAARLFW